MKILIYGVNYSPELTGIGKYTGEMSDWLAKNQNEVRVITAPPYYPEWKIWKGYSSWSYIKEKHHNITVFRCPLWVPRNPKTISRLFHLFSFCVFSFPVLLSQRHWKPDIVICIAPSFFCTPQALLFSKIVKAKSWLHFQDFEICAMFRTGMASKLKGLNKFAHSIQSLVTRKFDRVSTISHSMCKSANHKKVSLNSVVFFPNWADINFITPKSNIVTFRKKWKIKDDSKIVLYSGNLGQKQGLELIIKTAKILKNEKKIIFLIVGNGAFKDFLQRIATDEKLDNIVFKPLQPYQLLPDLLNTADIHLVIQKKGTGDSFLPSKLTSIFSAGGHAVITAEKGTELHHIINTNPGIATMIPPEEPDVMADAILLLLKKESLQNNYIARNYAEKNIDKEAVLSTFFDKLTGLVNS